MHMLTSATGTSVLWNYEHRLAYCPNAKTGTTTWMHVLLEVVPWLATESRDNWGGRFHVAMERLFKLPMKWPGGKKLFDRLFSFFFIRHPFVRLVSAYQDKVWARVYTVYNAQLFLFAFYALVSICRLWTMQSTTSLTESHTKATTRHIYFPNNILLGHLSVCF